ncbi:MAG: AraC family transcriptional regulator [Pedosphaera sp.]|nr:AraC family transcriptional regulator [Pedosphaera sp.]
MTVPHKASVAGKILGTATDLVAGQIRPQTRSGTSAGVMPDPRFRLRITVVEHEHSCQMHTHEYSEICLVFGGRATHLTEYGNHPLGAGDAFVINSDNRHGFTDTHKLKLCNVMFDPRQFLSGQRDLHRLMGYHALFDLQPRATHPKEFRERLHLLPTDLSRAQQLVVSMQDETSRHEEGWQTVVHSFFLQLATLLSRCYASQQKHQVTPLTRLANVVAHIQKHFREPLRIEDLARLAHLSTSQFQRTFKRSYNTTVVKFVTRLRLHEACELLKDLNNDVTRAALECGFNSPAFFSTQFKELMGESPSAYRRRQGQ